MSDEKRATVIVNCSVPNGVQLRRHVPAVHPFAPQMPDGEGVKLKAGQNPGIDKEWFDGWLDENKNLSLVTDGLITAIDEDPDNPGQPSSAQRKEATMDHDVMHKDVQNLKKFKAEAEEAITFYKGLKAAGGTLPAAVAGPDPVVEELSKHVDSLGEAVTLLQQAQGSSNELNDIRSRLTELEKAKLPDGIPVMFKGTQEEADAWAARLDAMLDWFDTNKEGLEILLGLDGEPDTAGTATGTANPSATDVTGAAAEKPAPDAAPADQASPAAPPAGSQA